MLAGVVAATPGCRQKTPGTESNTTAKDPPMNNPVVYVEIPVIDLDRAVRFYGSVFGFRFQRERIDGNEMALFPFADSARGISGALAKGSVYKPTLDGAVVYFHCNDIAATLDKGLQAGGAVLYPKTPGGELGFVAELRDSEGNRIALHQPSKKHE